MNLPQDEVTFLTDDLKGEASAVGAFKAIPFFETAYINCFSAAETG
jgi:hypothetical protein